MNDEIHELRRSHVVVNAVMCLGEKYEWSEHETLERMVIELAKADNAKLEELVRLARISTTRRFAVAEGPEGSAA